MNTHSVTYYLNKREVDFDGVLMTSQYCRKVEAVRDEMLETLGDVICEEHGQGVNVDIWVSAAEGVVSKFVKKLVGGSEARVACTLRFCCEHFGASVYNMIAPEGFVADDNAPKESSRKCSTCDAPMLSGFMFIGAGQGAAWLHWSPWEDLTGELELMKSGGLFEEDTSRRAHLCPVCTSLVIERVSKGDKLAEAKATLGFFMTANFGR